MFEFKWYYRVNEKGKDILESVGYDYYLGLNKHMIIFAGPRDRGCASGCPWISYFKKKGRRKAVHFSIYKPYDKFLLAKVN